MKLQVTFTDDKVVFLNTKTEKTEGFGYFDHIDAKTAVGQLRKEVDGRPNMTRAVLSLLVDVLQVERLQAYKGLTPLNEALPKEFKQAMREVESGFLRPLFIDMQVKTLSNEEKGKIADKYVSEAWAGGVYAKVKAEVSKYFCQVGKLPCVYNDDGTPDTDKLLSSDAINRLIANAKADAATPASDETIKDKHVRRLMAFMVEFKERKADDMPAIDEVKMALNAAKVLVTAYEKMQNKYAELRTRAGSSVNDKVKDAIGAASASAKPAKAGTAKEAATV